MKIDVKFSESTQSFNPKMDELDHMLEADFGQVQEVTSIDGVQYDGEYAVVPKIDSQVLPTKNKVMVDDLTITAIPVYRVSNTSGGTTVYIANEV